MKTSKYILLMTAMIMLPICSFSQSRAIGHMSVTIVSPAALSSVQDINLGNVSFSSNNTISNISASTKNFKNTDGIEKVNEGNVSLASFKVSGQDATYSITLPDEPVMTTSNGNDMKVSGFRTIKNSSAMQTGNSENIVVGATVQVKGDNAYGLYASATPMRVTVNYN